MAVTTKAGTARQARIKKALKAAYKPALATGGEDTVKIRVCAGTACHASGRCGLRKALDKALADRSLSDKVAVVETGCHGFCEEGPIVVVRPQGLFYPRLKPKDIEEIIETSVVGDGIVERLRHKDPRPVSRWRTRRTSRSTRCRSAGPGAQRQDRPVLGRRLPGHGGYAAARHGAQDWRPRERHRRDRAAGLRGRGGAGFPTGRKWRDRPQAPR